jgi:hypothetical protein
MYISESDLIIESQAELLDKKVSRNFSKKKSLFADKEATIDTKALER